MTLAHIFFLSAKTDCTATKVDNSDKSADNSITGKTGDKVLVTCDSPEYFGTRESECLPNGTFSEVKCISKHS